MLTPANTPPALVLGIETSCDETGIALFHTEKGLLAHVLHSQAPLHAEYGGVVPELASRDHIRRVLPLVRKTLAEAGCTVGDLGAIAYTEGPGLAGALLVGAAIARGLGYALGIPVLGLHHLECHLLSPLLSDPAPRFPFIALLVSGGHTQLMHVAGIGDYETLGETHDDAAGEAFDKTAKLLGLGYPGGPELAKLAQSGRAGRFKLPRPMLAQVERSGDLNFSFSGLKTAVMTLVKQEPLGDADRADLAAEIQAAIADVLVGKAAAAMVQTGLKQLVVAGGVGANRLLRSQLSARAQRDGFSVFYPELEFCTDNGAMIALTGALRLRAANGRIESAATPSFSVRPRWNLEDLNAPGDQL